MLVGIQDASTNESFNEEAPSVCLFSFFAPAVSYLVRCSVRPITFLFSMGCVISGGWDIRHGIIGGSSLCPVT